MKTLRASLLIIIILLILIQLIPNKLPPNSGDNSQDIIAKGYAGTQISPIIKISCYNCHSNRVNYPWYSHVAPSSWLVRRDVVKGRDALNFSEWNGYSKRRMISKLQNMKEETQKGEMPLPAYTLMHHNAKLNADQKKIIARWTDELSQKILQEK